MEEEQSVGGAALKGGASGAATGAVFGPWGAAIGGAVGAGVGIYQATQANKALKNLAGKPMPNYTLSPEQQDYYNRANAQSQYGFDPGQVAAFKQNVSQQYNTGYRNAVNQSGGNMAQALANGLGAQRLNSFNQFAADDASLKQRKFAQLGGVVNGVQGQYNLATGENIHRRYALENAYGHAMQAGLANTVQGIQSGIGLYYQAKKDGLGNQSQQQSQDSTQYYQGGGFSSPNLSGSNSNYNYPAGQNSLNMNQQPQFNMGAQTNYYTQ